MDTSFNDVFKLSDNQPIIHYIHDSMKADYCVVVWAANLSVDFLNNNEVIHCLAGSLNILANFTYHPLT